jgi:hypothetical protein
MKNGFKPSNILQNINRQSKMRKKTNPRFPLWAKIILEFPELIQEKISENNHNTVPKKS